ncbi:acyl carrier protein [Lignipirellula cremea]|uniref:Acyl carrier protein n=1 Tax=Lignipirellula cremea TaxID=2528010 RepID=A0A518E3I8_9BACT|nr:hypothetical protein [Lignipirellula cremea]QDU98651.1 hypothetical protein Pla8534_65230 [Lignipirellula cremea]
MKNPLVIEQELLEFVSQNADYTGEMDKTVDLIDESILDSLLVTDLALFIESSYGVTLGVGDISPGKMRSVERIAQLVCTKLEKAAKAA